MLFLVFGKCTEFRPVFRAFGGCFLRRNPEKGKGEEGLSGRFPSTRKSAGKWEKFYNKSDCRDMVRPIFVYS